MERTISECRFLKNLCEIRNISLDNLFIVPGNHDVNRTASDRENVVENMLWHDNKSWSRNYKTKLGNIGDSTLQALHDGEKEFRASSGKYMIEINYNYMMII